MYHEQIVLVNILKLKVMKVKVIWHKNNKTI